MTKVRTMFMLITLIIVCAGCVSYPFIDDSIAKLEATPVDVTLRFKLPEVPPRPIEPQTADALVGDWMTGFHNVDFFFIPSVTRNNTVTFEINRTRCSFIKSD